MDINFLAVIVSALVPLVVGFVWYNPKVFGKAWMEASGMTEEKAKGASMAKMFGLTILMSFLLAFFMQSMVIHQFHIASLFYQHPIDDPASPAGSLYKQMLDMFATSWRTFKHGALHGFLAALFIITPTLVVNSLFEMRSFKYIAINMGYWIVSMTIMGGILSCWM